MTPVLIFTEETAIFSIDKAWEIVAFHFFTEIRTGKILKRVSSPWINSAIRLSVHAIYLTTVYVCLSTLVLVRIKAPQTF